MKIINFLLVFLLFCTNNSFSYEESEFNKWKLDFKKYALKNDISENTFNLVMANV